ncbi:MAG: hypothetical protein DMG61_06540 [Acidobacteria bacterium]|nr:MAG: hypothetical protein DMG61_06540 [Acidobacteriota bacterium]PYY18246.1 MAG: hypothetical protein DMG60_08985 [Acidobacteriota bacterium]
MRSELVFRANDKVANRFELCHLASSSARTMVRNSQGMHLTINQAFEAISGQSVPAKPVEVSLVEDAGASMPALDPVV